MFPCALELRVVEEQDFTITAAVEVDMLSNGLFRILLGDFKERFEDEGVY